MTLVLNSTAVALENMWKVWFCVPYYESNRTNLKLISSRESIEFNLVKLKQSAPVHFGSNITSRINNSELILGLCPANEPCN